MMHVYADDNSGRAMTASATPRIASVVTHDRAFMGSRADGSGAAAAAESGATPACQ